MNKQIHDFVKSVIFSDAPDNEKQNMLEALARAMPEQDVGIAVLEIPEDNQVDSNKLAEKTANYLINKLGLKLLDNQTDEEREAESLSKLYPSLANRGNEIQVGNLNLSSEREEYRHLLKVYSTMGENYVEQESQDQD